MSLLKNMYNTVVNNILQMGEFSVSFLPSNSTANWFVVAMPVPHFPASYAGAFLKHAEEEHVFRRLCFD